MFNIQYTLFKITQIIQRITLRYNVFNVYVLNVKRCSPFYVHEYRRRAKLFKKILIVRKKPESEFFKSQTDLLDFFSITLLIHSIKNIKKKIIIIFKVFSIN